MKFPENTYDFKKNRVLLSHLNIELPLVKFDAMLAKYLISTTEDNKISTIARLFDVGHLATDEEILAKVQNLLYLMMRFCLTIWLVKSEF